MTDTTSKPYDGGPAFPVQEQHDDGSHYVTHNGMSRRDWFAGQALTLAAAVLHDNDSKPDIDGIAGSAYAVADAMLRQSDAEQVDQRLAAAIKRAEDAEKSLDEMRPVWAMGHTSDSVAAQSLTVALARLWAILGVNNQTDAVAALCALKARKA